MKFFIDEKIIKSIKWNINECNLRLRFVFWAKTNEIIVNSNVYYKYNSNDLLINWVLFFYFSIIINVVHVVCLKKRNLFEIKEVELFSFYFSVWGD